MWALFSLRRWGRWRQRDLRSTPLPWIEYRGEPPPPRIPRTPLLYGFPACVVPPPGWFPRVAGGSSVGCLLHPVALAGYWPASLTLCGFWRLQSQCVVRCHQATGTVRPAKRRRLEEGDSQATRPVAICFGSMEHMGLIDRPLAMLRVLADCLQRLGRPAIMVVSPHGDTYSAWCAAAVNDLGCVQAAPKGGPWESNPAADLCDWAEWKQWLALRAGLDDDDDFEVSGSEELARWVWCCPCPVRWAVVASRASLFSRTALQMCAGSIRVVAAAVRAVRAPRWQWVVQRSCACCCTTGSSPLAAYCRLGPHHHWRVGGAAVHV